MGITLCDSHIINFNRCWGEVIGFVICVNNGQMEIANRQSAFEFKLHEVNRNAAIHFSPYCKHHFFLVFTSLSRITWCPIKRKTNQITYKYCNLYCHSKSQYYYFIQFIFRAKIKCEFFTFDIMKAHAGYLELSECVCELSLYCH